MILILTKVNADENEITLKNVLLAINFSIIVPKHLLLDIVKQYWLSKVKVEARQTSGGIIVLQNINIAA